MLPLLRTKTAIPPISPRQMARPRLLARMAEGAQRALTLITAPAGFGKTTLAAAWARGGGAPAAWLSLQPGDGARGRLLAYLIQALQTLFPQTGQTALALLQGGSPDGALFSLVNDLSEIERDFALVLDDYHSVDGPECSATLQFLLENRPAAFHLIITARAAPALNLARLRALDQVVEISTADLRFTEAEVRAYLETCLGLHLASEALNRLNQSTEGWAVGLQLAGLALARQPSGWQAFAGQEHIFDYLAEEVLRREPPEVQEFLKVTALFDRFCAPLCDAVLAAKAPAHPGSSTDLLAAVERANLFLVPLDAADSTARGGAVWYRYQGLFAEFLRRQMPAGQAAPFYRAAGRWFEQNDLLDDAIHYAVHAEDFTRAADLLESRYIDVLQRGEQSALLEWIDGLPRALLDSRARLWLAKGWASIILLDPVQAEICVQKAEERIPPGQASDRLWGEAKSLRALTYIFSGKTGAGEALSPALALLAEQDDFLHSMLHFNLGLHHIMRGETAQALDALSETLRLTQTAKNPLVSIVAQVQLGETRQMRGALGLAERTFQQVIRYAKATLGERTVLLGMPYVSYADLLREQNRFDEAATFAEQGIAYCQVWQPIASMDGQIALARMMAAQGRWSEAFQVLDTSMQVAEASASVLDDTFIVTQLARLALLQGDVIKARHFIDIYRLEDSSVELYYHMREMAQLVILRARIAECPGDPAAAAALAEQGSALVAESERRERMTPTIEGLLLHAYACHAAAQHSAAFHAAAAESLSRALTLGAQGGYVRIFADEGRPLLHLLEQYRARVHAPRTYFEHIRALLDQESARPSAPGPAAFSLPEGLAPLTRRELDILALLADGKSNQEIAAERTLTLNTVKKHVANILSKLGVANRTQAVLLARKMGWIG